MMGDRQCKPASRRVFECTHSINCYYSPNLIFGEGNGGSGQYPGASASALGRTFPQSHPRRVHMFFTRKRRAQFRRVILFYVDAGLSHSIVKFADLLPLVFENFPNAEIVVYNNDNNVASLYQPLPARVLIAMPGPSSQGPGCQLRPDTEEATLTLRFRKS